MVCENQGAFKVSPIWKKFMMRGAQLTHTWSRKVPSMFEEPMSPHPDSQFPLEMKEFVLSTLKSKNY